VKKKLYLKDKKIRELIKKNGKDGQKKFFALLKRAATLPKS
jgi:hypothetical protein